MYIKRALGAVLTKSPECRTYEKLTREELEEDKDLQLVQRRQVSLGPKGRVVQVPKGLLSDALKAPIPIYMTLKDSRDDHVLQQDALKSLCIKEMEQMRAFDALMVQCSKEFIHLSQHHLEMVTRLQDVKFFKRSYDGFFLAQSPLHLSHGVSTSGDSERGEYLQRIDFHKTNPQQHRNGKRGLGPVFCGITE